jgi:hypothetical protein
MRSETRRRVEGNCASQLWGFIVPYRWYLLALSSLLTVAAAFAQTTPTAATTTAASPTAESPAFTLVPELRAGFDLLYEQKFSEGREVFANWEAQHPEQPFGQAALAASYLFEELYRQEVLTSEFFLDEKRFLRGINGQPDADRMQHFREAVARTQQLARSRLKSNPNDGEALFALTLVAGMQSDASTILDKKHLDGLARMKEANKYGKQLLAQHPEASDAYVALGIANYIIGSLNSGARFALWFDGVHGDKKLGMEQVGKTAENGRYLQPFAKITLALAARREKQPALATKLLRELTEQYPGSALFASEYAKAASVHAGD